MAWPDDQRRTWHGARTERARRGRGISLSDLWLMVLAGCALGLILSGTPLSPLAGPTRIASPPQAIAPAAGRTANFALCHGGGGTDCVVDGDTFYLGGEKIRIADIDTPETHPPRCAAEAELGERATLRLRALLNDGAFALETIDRDEDIHGRKLRTVTRDGRSLGDLLVGEGLARPYGEGRRSWCDR